MDWLLTKKMKSDLRKVKNVCYTWDDYKGAPSSFKHYSFALPSNNRQKFKQDSRTICIKPSEYEDCKPAPSITSLRTKWFLNLSGNIIPTNVQKLIQLGDNFFLPTYNNKNKLSVTLKNFQW